MTFTNRVQRLFGRSDDESPEEFVRRVDRSPIGSQVGYRIRPAVPSIVELYDRMASLEQRVRVLEQLARPSA